MMTSSARTLLLIGLLIVWGSCSDDVVDRTVVTLRIQRSSSVEARMTKLQVRALRGGSSAGWQVMDYPRQSITWPANVHLIPPDNANDKNGSFEISVAAFEGETRLVEQRLLVLYSRHQQRLVGVVLEPCGSKPLGEVCSLDQNCTGSTCQSCFDGMCQTRPEIQMDDPDPPLPPDLDGGPLPDPVPVDRDADAGDADADAGFDAGDADASRDAEVDADAELDASDADADAAPADADAAPEPDEMDASDAADASDASDAADADTGVDTGPPPVDCTTGLWTTARANSAVGPSVFIGAMPDLEGTVVPQYVCREDQIAGSLISGKVNGQADGLNYRDSCYYAAFDANAGLWSSQPTGDVSGQEFQALTTKPGCTLAWVDAVANQPLPATALKTGNDGSTDLYTCRIDVAQTQSTGKHIGRASGAAPAECRIQFYSGTIPAATFQVLTQSPTL